MDQSDIETKLIEMPAPEPAFHVASTWKRLGAILIDGICYLVMFFVLAMALGLHMTKQEMTFSWPLYISSTLAGFAFQVFFLKYEARTPGKMALGLYVVDFATQRPALTWRHALLRSAAGMSSLVFSLAPQAIAFFRADRRQFQDLVAGTQVVQRVARENAPRPRPVVGTLFFVLFGLSGIANFAKNMKMYEFGAQGVTVKMETQKSE